MEDNDLSQFASQLFCESELLGVSFTFGPNPNPFRRSPKLYYIELKNKSFNSEFPNDYTEVNYETLHPHNFDEVIRCREKLKSEWWKKYQYVDEHPEIFGGGGDFGETDINLETDEIG